MPNIAKLQAIVTQDINVVAPADGVIAAPDKNMELLFVWWSWDELLPCATAPNTEFFWTNEVFHPKREYK
jgi:hypothetical protein